MLKIAVLGGTFDPIHLGHLAMAERALNTLDLTEVVFMPAGQPCFKDSNLVTAPEDRVQMIKLAIGGSPQYSLSLMEIERPGPSYAVDSMSALRSRLGRQDELYFVMGWDSLVSLPYWHQASRLIEICRIIAIPRPGSDSREIRTIAQSLPGLEERSLILTGPLIDISSTEIRRRVSQGLSISGLVTPQVEDYIFE